MNRKQRENALNEAENKQIDPSKPKPRARLFTLLRNILIIAFLVGLFILFYFVSPDFNYGVRYVIDILSHGDLERLKWYLRSFGIWAPIISASIMVFQSVLAPLPAFVVTLTNGLLFGAFWGTMLSWSSSMLGAVICFYIARVLGRPAVERFVSPKALNFVDHFFERYGNNSVLIARLLPVVSFDAVSYVAGLTKISFWGFFWASAIGELPATIVYSWLGQSMTSVAKLGLWAFCGVAALIALALIIKRMIDTRIKKKIETNGSEVAK